MLPKTNVKRKIGVEQPRMLLATPGIQRGNEQRTLTVTVAPILYQESADAANNLTDSHDRCTHFLVAEVGEEDDKHTT